MKAAFTKEVDFFAERGIEYLDPALTFTEPTLLRAAACSRRFGPRARHHRGRERLRLPTRRWKALRRLRRRRCRSKGRAILETVEAENRVAILLLGRPYHSDPGLNHGILRSSRCSATRSCRSARSRRTASTCDRFFEEELESGRDRDAARDQRRLAGELLGQQAQKVWAAKFAARHPNVVVLDLSSFKCGHDAPTYGLIDSIIADVADAVLGAARHRRQQAGRLDQDPRQDLRPQPEAARGAARGRRAQEAASSRYRIDEKRLELLELKQRSSWPSARRKDPALEQQIDELAEQGARPTQAPAPPSPSRRSGLVAARRRSTKTASVVAAAAIKRTETETIARI